MFAQNLEEKAAPNTHVKCPQQNLGGVGGQRLKTLVSKKKV